jgi:hypothetical protein
VTGFEAVHQRVRCAHPWPRWAACPAPLCPAPPCPAMFALL